MSVALKASVGVPLEQSRMVHGALGKLPPQVLAQPFMQHCKVQTQRSDLLADDDGSSWQASPMVNRPAFKLPAAIQRSADSGRKRPAGAPLRRVLGSKRLHYFTASTPTRLPMPPLLAKLPAASPKTQGFARRSPSEATPDDRHGNRPQGGGVEHEGITARNLSLDLVSKFAYSLGLR